MLSDISNCMPSRCTLMQLVYKHVQGLDAAAHTGAASAKQQSQQETSEWLQAQVQHWLHAVVPYVTRHSQ